MNLFLKIGSFIVLLALISYAIAVLTEQRKRVVSNKVLIFIIVGVCLDITATAFMICGSSKGLITLHGLIGYSALLAMLTDAVLLYRFRAKQGSEAIVPKTLHLYSRYAFLWWITAFFTGGLLAMLHV
jgi:hypothetical protein